MDRAGGFLNKLINEDDTFCERTFKKLYEAQKAGEGRNGSKTWFATADEAPTVSSWIPAGYQARTKGTDLYYDLNAKNLIGTMFVGPLPCVGLRCDISSQQRKPGSLGYTDALEGQSLEQLTADHRVYLLTSIAKNWPERSRRLIEKRLDMAHKALVNWLEDDDNVCAVERFAKNPDSEKWTPSNRYSSNSPRKLTREYAQEVRNILIKTANKQRRKLISGTNEREGVEIDGILNLKLAVQWTKEKNNKKLSTQIAVLSKKNSAGRKVLTMASSVADNIRNTVFEAYLELDDSIFRLTKESARVTLMVKSIMYRHRERSDALIPMDLYFLDDDDEGKKKKQDQVDAGDYTMDDDFSDDEPVRRKEDTGGDAPQSVRRGSSDEEEGNKKKKSPAACRDDSGVKKKSRRDDDNNDLSSDEGKKKKRRAHSKYSSEEDGERSPRKKKSADDERRRNKKKQRHYSSDDNE